MAASSLLSCSPDSPGYERFRISRLSKPPDSPGLRAPGYLPVKFHHPECLNFKNPVHKFRYTMSELTNPVHTIRYTKSEFSTSGTTHLVRTFGHCVTYFWYNEKAQRNGLKRSGTQIRTQTQPIQRLGHQQSGTLKFIQKKMKKGQVRMDFVSRSGMRRQLFLVEKRGGC